jgi:hypothetical protein
VTNAAAISVQGVIMTMIALLQSVRRKQEGKQMIPATPDRLIPEFEQASRFTLPAPPSLNPSLCRYSNGQQAEN